MSQKILAIDPGTNESGTALFIDGKLVQLENMNLPTLCLQMADPKTHFVIENVASIKTTYANKRNGSINAQRRKAQNVGQCKGAYRQIVQFLKANGCNYTKIPPTSGNWGTAKPATGRMLLARFLHWTGKSNRDTRSAAFFGFLFLRLEESKRLNEARKARARG